MPKPHNAMPMLLAGARRGAAALALALCLIACGAPQSYMGTNLRPGAAAPEVQAATAPQSTTQPPPAPTFIIDPAQEARILPMTPRSTARAMLVYLDQHRDRAVSVSEMEQHLLHLTPAPAEVDRYVRTWLSGVGNQDIGRWPEQQQYDAAICRSLVCGPYQQLRMHYETENYSFDRGMRAIFSNRYPAERNSFTPCTFSQMASEFGYHKLETTYILMNLRVYRYFTFFRRGSSRNLIVVIHNKIWSHEPARSLTDDEECQNQVLMLSFMSAGVN